MGRLFEIDADTRSVIQDGLDDMIDQLGKPCILVYPPKYIICGNCIYDQGTERSSNHYRHGGSIPFPDGGICPNCNGKGRRAEEVRETVTLLCEWEPKKFIYPISNLNIRVPFSILQTKGYVRDQPKVEKCDRLLFQTAQLNFGEKPYKLYSEPGDRSNIIQGRYFVCLWKREE